MKKGQLSVAVTSKSTIDEHAPGSRLIVILAGHVIVGGTASLTTKDCVIGVTHGSTYVSVCVPSGAVTGNKAPDPTEGAISIPFKNTCIVAVAEQPGNKIGAAMD